jgi:hypothetical protein
MTPDDMAAEIRNCFANCGNELRGSLEAIGEAFVDLADEDPRRKRLEAAIALALEAKNSGDQAELDRWLAEVSGLLQQLVQ